MRKEVKKYYHDDRLNRGYPTDLEEGKGATKSKTHEASHPSPNKRNRLEGFLPPIEVLSKYEDEIPGSFAQIMKLAEEEQKIKYQTEALEIEANYRAVRIGKVFGVFVVAIISWTVMFLAVYGIFAAIIFAAIAFSSIFGISLMSFLKLLPKDHSYKGKNNTDPRPKYDPKRNKQYRKKQQSI
ncbi:MAG: hypothetical protein EB127_14600 [Alphaproteobacteria bacterium]|nr:hypothetical protein [Alphaproteobacteria bacterium]